MLLEQKLIQYNFDHAAKTYSAHANMQKITAAKIADYLMYSNYTENALTLDLGSGPGTLPGKLNNTLLYDISLEMLKRRTDVDKRCINGTAAKLPFADKTFNLVISNLMIQWSIEKEQVFSEANRVLDDEGVFIVTTLVDKSLWQLESAWRKLDNSAHILNFATKDDYLNLVRYVGFDVLVVDEWQHTECFHEIDSLLRSFKLTGTSIPKSTCNQGLGGRSYLQKLDRVYPRINNKLLLSYHNLLLVLKKKCNTTI